MARPTTRLTEEIIRRMPAERRYPRNAAESVRSFLILRLGLHLGVRQKNLRQLLYVERGSSPTPERVLDPQSMAAEWTISSGALDGLRACSFSCRLGELDSGA